MRSNSLKIFVFLLFFCFIFVVPVYSQTQDDMLSGGDAGNTIDTATLIEINEGNGYNAYPDQDDWYKIPVVKDQEISVRLSSNTGYFNLQLYDTNQQRVDSVSHDGGDSPPVWVSWTATKSGFFYIAVKHSYYSADTYSLQIYGMTTPNTAPTASFFWATNNGELGVNAVNSNDPDGTIASYIWYLDGILAGDSSEEPVWFWDSLTPGVYEISLIVIDDDGVASEPYILSVEIETPPRADVWIIGLVSSDNVIPGGLISVNVTVGYIFDLETVVEAGLKYSDAGLYLIEFRDTVSGEGSKTYTLEFEAPMSPGVYSLTADIPYWTGVEWVWGNESRQVFIVNILDNSSDFFEISDLQYPSNVQSGAEIQVSITIQYELTNGTVGFGIVSLDSEEIPTASVIPLTGTGTKTVDFTFPAPIMEGTYNYTASVVLIGGESVDEPFQVIVTQSVEISPEAFFEWWMQDGHLYLDGSDSIVPGNVTEYRWFFNGELVENALSRNFWSISLPSGVWEVSLIIMDGEIASEPFTLSVVVPSAPVNQSPIAVFEWWVSDNTLYVDASKSSDTDGEIVNYEWFVNDEYQASFRGTWVWTWSDIPKGTYDITLLVQDDSGNEGSTRVTVEVKGGIPGFPIQSIVLGVLLSLFILKKIQS